MQLFNYYFSNFLVLFQKRLLVDLVPKCNQKLLISGKGKLILGNHCEFGFKLGGNYYGGLVEIQPRYEDSKIEIGNNVSTNNNLFICCANHISIGDDTLIGSGVSILDHEAHNISPSKRRMIGDIGSVSLGRNVWIGNNVLILKNSIIGDNSIVAAGAIVSGIFPANVIIGGIPAKIIREIND
jgi:acetyltransferase-like isoleucine patch superfamily enzyme